MLSFIGWFFACIALYFFLGLATFLFRGYRGLNSSDTFDRILQFFFWPIALYSAFTEIPGSADPSKVLRFVPRCTRRVALSAKSRSGQPLSGVFTFRSSDVQQALELPSAELDFSSLDTAYFPAGGKFGVPFRQWITERDDTNDQISTVPDLFLSRFTRNVSGVIRDGHALIFCRECDTTVPPSDLMLDEVVENRMHNVHYYLCPRRHVLFECDRRYVPRG